MYSSFTSNIKRIQLDAIRALKIDNFKLRLMTATWKNKSDVCEQLGQTQVTVDRWLRGDIEPDLATFLYAWLEFYDRKLLDPPF